MLKNCPKCNREYNTTTKTRYHCSPECSKKAKRDRWMRFYNSSPEYRYKAKLRKCGVRCEK